MSIYIKQFFDEGVDWQDETIYFITDGQILHLKTLAWYGQEIKQDVGVYVVEDEQEKEKVMRLLRADPSLETERYYYGVKIWELDYISAAKLLLLGKIPATNRKKYEYYVGLGGKILANEQEKTYLFNKYKNTKLEEI